MTREWRAICKECGEEFGYSDAAHEVGMRRGLSRPERCPKCRAIRARESRSMGLAYYQVKPIKQRVPTAELRPGLLGRLHHPEREHRRVEVEAKFHQPDSDIKFGIKDEDIIELIEILRKHQVTVIEGPTGSGKSTFLPYRLMEPPEGIRPDEFTRYGPIVVTQPRIQATRGVSTFVARDLHGSSLGAGFDVGFRHRGAPAMDWRNKLVYVTDGTLLNWIISGQIANFSVIMIDEAHERSLNIDLILGLLKEHLPRYPHLKLIISSATINPALFISYFGRGEAGIELEEVKAGKLAQEGIEALARRVGVGYKRFSGLQRYEVRTFFRPESQKLSLNPWEMPTHVAKEVLSILRDIACGKRRTESGEWESVPEGDILAFLHGEEPINQAVAKVRLAVETDDLLRGRGIEVLPLYARLPLEDQDYALRKKSETIRRKVMHTLHEIADGKKPDGDILALLLDNRSAEEAAKKIRRSLEEEGIDGTDVHVFLVDEGTPSPWESPQGRRVVVVSTHDGGAHLNLERFRHVVVDRRVVISTNVAETSLTVDGIVYVVDSGLITQRCWDPRTATESFRAVRHSKAGCRQRWGRAGRVRDGEAHCLYTKSQFEDDDIFPPYTQPEIQRAPLEQIVLTAKTAGVDDVVNFDWIEPPPLEELERAQRALMAKGALDEGGNLTDHGMELRYFCEEPDVANLLIMADRFACAVEIATLIPMMRLKVRGGILRWNPKWDAATWIAVRRIHQGLMAHCRDDIEFFLKLYAAWEEAGDDAQRKEWADRHFVNHKEMMTRVFEPREELLEELSIGKKEKERRPIDFDLIDRVRMIWAYCWPEWAFERVQAEEGLLYRPLRKPPWAHEEDTAVPVRIEIGEDSVCSGRPPDAFVCGRRYALRRGEDITLRVSCLAEIKPEWLTWVNYPLLKFGQLVANATRSDGRLRQTFARERLFLDQVYPVGSRHTCQVVDIVESDIARLEIKERLSPPPKVEETFPEGEIVWRTDIGEGPGLEIDPTAGSDPDIIPTFDPESEESPAALTAYESPVGEDALLRIVQAALNTPPLELYLDGSKIADDFKFLDNTGYMALPAGEHRLDVNPAAEGESEAAITLTLILEEGEAYTAVLVRQKGNSLRVKILKDCVSEIREEVAMVRFFHASPDTPTLDVFINSEKASPPLPFLERTRYFELPAQSTQMSFYAQGVESQEPLLGLQLPLEPGKAYTISLTGLQANGSLSATVWRDGLEKTIIPLRLGPETKEGLNFEAFKPLGRMPVKEAGDEIGGTLEAEVIRFGGDPSEPSVILRPSPEPGPFPRFTQKFELGDEVWVEAVTIEEVPDENLVALVVKEEESGLEVAMEPSDLTFAGRFNVKETIKPGSRFKAVVKKILPDSCRVYLSCLPLLEKDLEAFSDRIDRELFDAQICEMTRQGLFVLITPSSANLPLGHMAYVHKGSLPRDRKSYKIGERCKVRLSFSNRCYANLPRLPKEVIEVLRSKKWRQKLKWEGESKKLLFQGQMSEEDRAELRELCEDVYFHRALDMLYRHSHSLHAEIIDLDLLRDFEERHKPGDRVTAIVKDIWGKVAVLELAPGVRTQVQLWDFALNLGEEPVRRVQKGNKVDVLIKSIVIEEGRVEVKPILPTDDLEERFPLGSTVQGKVVELKPYGAFVEIEPGITGLVRTREMSWCQVAKPSDVVSKGDTVTVRILAIRPDRKIDLSMRTEENDPERKYPPDSQVSVKIIKLKKYGALARLEPGIVGLIHISELDWDHIDHPREVVHEGQELTVRVKDVYQDLKVEGNPRRLDLSRKRAFQAKMIIPKTEIGKLIGRGGRTIKPIKEDTKTEIKVNDEGIVRIWGASEEGVNAAQERIKEVVPQAEVICED